LLAALLLLFFQITEFLNVNDQLFLKPRDCKLVYFKSQTMSDYACMVHIMEYYWIIRTVQTIMSKQKQKFSDTGHTAYYYVLK